MLSSNDIEELRRMNKVIKRAAAIIDDILDKDGPRQETFAMASQEPPAIEKRPTREEHVEALLGIKEWPEAVPAFIVSSVTEQDHVNRANSVLDMMLDGSIGGRRFLEYGCGDGWICREAKSRGVAESVGYDPIYSEKWSKAFGVKLTNDFSDLPAHYFDAVMVYDVLDHAPDPMKVISDVKHVLKKNGKVYVRCHPWTARHASHLFRKGVNKAYFHLFLTTDEIAKLIGEAPMYTRPDKSPMETYRKLFCDFRIIKERTMDEPVSDFFKIPAFKELLASEQGISLAHIDTFLKLMEIQFADFWLTPL